MTDEIPPSIKFKMLMDAGYHMPDPWPAYILLVDEIKSFIEVEESCCPYIRDLKIQFEKLLEKIGEE